MKPATAPSAVKIQAVLGERFTVLEFEAGTRSAADAAAAIGCAVTEIAKSMIFRTVTSGRPVLVVASGDKRVDEKKFEGQVHGALVQGIGQALYENAVYDENGQLEAGSFMDYCMPRADNFLPFKLETNTTLCAHNPLGAKGCGEAGTIGAPPAIMNAVVDALAPLGIVDIDMPATSERVWRAMAGCGKPSMISTAGFLKASTRSI
jgi:CO/xanthine dehydrogenase Mo-binding subunit